MGNVVERLTKDNVLELRKLNGLFAEVFEDQENYQQHKPDNKYVADFLGDKRNIVLVAMRDGHVTGGLVAYVLVKFEQERKEVYLYDLAVATNFQRQGVGKSLVDTLREIAESIGAYVVFVQADESDTAIDFYESLEPTENIRTRSFDFNVAATNSIDRTTP